MTFDAKQMVRVARRVREATGYIELGMAQQTLDCLAALGPLGPFESEVARLRGAAMQRQERFEEAAAAFAEAARTAPLAKDKSAWLALSLCYREFGDVDRAVQMLGTARGALPPGIGPTATD